MIMQLIDIGKMQITVFGEIVKYSGEIIDGDKATGTGVGEYIVNNTKRSSHWVNDMQEGAGTFFNSKLIPAYRCEDPP